MHLHEQDGFEISIDAFYEAAARDKLSAIKWLLGLGLTWDKKALILMLHHGSLHCLKHALENEQPLPGGAIHHAAVYNQLDMMRYLLSIGVQPESYTMENALYRRNVETIRIFREAGCEWPQNTLSTFVMYDSLDCLILAHENGCPLTAGLCNIAAQYSHLRCLEYLHLHGCPWNASTTHAAVKEGHVECLKYAHQNGCAMSPRLPKYAISYQTFECIPYLVWHGAMDFDFKMCCISWVCLFLLRVVLWWTNHCVNTIFTIAGAWTFYWTLTLIGMTRSLLFASIFARCVIVGVAFQLACDMWYEGVVCLYE